MSIGLGPSPISGRRSIDLGALVGSLIPSADDTYDIGSAAFNWRHGFFSGDITLDALSKIYFDGGSDTYILEGAADQFSVFAGGVEGQRIIEANSIIYTFHGVTEADSVMSATINGTTTITKVGENFVTTAQVGDVVLFYSGTATADFGLYFIRTVTDNENLVLDRAPIGSETDMDFLILRGGYITTDTEIWFVDDSTAAGDTPSFIGEIVEAGLGTRTTIGVNERSRTIVISDMGDIRTDMGLSPAANPTLIFRNAGNTVNGLTLSMAGIISGTNLKINASKYFTFESTEDNNLIGRATYGFVSSSGIELTYDGPQSWMYIEPKINKATDDDGDAPYTGLQVKVTETDIDTAALNTLLKLGTSVDDDMFYVDNAGGIFGTSLTVGVGTKHDGYIIRDVAEVQTTDATQTTLDSITLLDENTYHVEAWIVAVQSDGTDRASYHIARTVYRTGAGNATLQGGITLLHAQESNAALDAVFTVSGNDIRVSVTGIAAETWEWGTTMKYINMSN